MKPIITLVAFCAASLFTSGSHAISCSGSPSYSAGTSYTQGQSVQNKGSLYRCDVAGWCSSTGAWAYEPGVGSAWQQAWTSLGVCDGTNVSSSRPSSSVASSSGGNTLPFVTTNATRTFVSGVYAINGSATVRLDVEGKTPTTMESTDYFRVYYRVNGGARVALTLNTDGFARRTNQVTVTGNTVVIEADAKTDAADESYHLYGITVTPIAASSSSKSSSSATGVTFGVEPAATSATFFVNISSGWADLHYIKNGAGQQNFSMPLVNGRRAYTLSNLVNGDQVRYWFTYQNPATGLAVDTAQQTYIHGSVASSAASAASSTPASTASSISNSSTSGLPGWNLVWSDEFNGTGQPDATKWNYHVGNGWNPGINNFDGWGNQEFQWYRPENCFQQGGNLVIRGEYKPISTNGRNFDWRSCRITTQGKKSWTYGRIEARLSSPSLQGKWNAFWMLGDSSNASYTTDYAAPVSRYDTMASNWPSIGEVDIFENVNQDAFTFHHNFWDIRTGVFPYNAGSVADYGGQGQINNTQNFHVYALEWDQNQQRYYVDGVQTFVIDITPGTLEEFHKPMHLILNMALGGRLTFGYNPIPSQWPRDMLVDYVRVYQKGTGGNSSSSSSSSAGGGGDWSQFNPGSPNAGATHPRLTVRNGCLTKPMTVHWLTAPGFKGGQFNAPNHNSIPAGGSMTYNIPDKGLASMRFWPAFDCDASGQNCRVGSSGGPAEFGFTCPPHGCAPPIDSKFEATFGCISGIADGSCQQNPSAPGQPLGRNDWWNSSAVDGFTVPMKVVVNGFCPTGPINVAPFWGPGGPTNGVIDCSALRVSQCPTTENLSADGRFPALSSVNLVANNPTGGVAGCYSPAGKLTYANWGNSPTYAPAAPEAQWYTCPTPPISPEACASGPADRSKYRNYIHSVCPTYAYAYDDGFGLSSCPASTLTTYEVTFYCP